MIFSALESLDFEFVTFFFLDPPPYFLAIFPNIQNGIKSEPEVVETFQNRILKALDAYFQNIILLMQNFTFLMPFCNQNGIIGSHIGNEQFGPGIPFWLQKGMKIW